MAAAVSDSVKKPQPTAQPEVKLINNGTRPDFDPCANACANSNVLSPFYLYNHESPRPSMECSPAVSRQESRPTTRSKSNVENKASDGKFDLSIHDLELGALTPSVSQEKYSAQSSKNPLRACFGQDRGIRRCPTKPKPKRGLASLPTRQRLIVKLVIAFLVVGIMVGIAVGIAAGLHSGVWKGDSQSKPIN